MKNFLFLICDQLQRNVLDIYGGPVNTLAWNILAEKGTVFERFYCATPLCVPTRPSMMCGRWPHSHGSICFSGGKDMRFGEYSTLSQGEELLIDKLHDCGYRVAFEGIWHIYRSEEEDRTSEYAHFKEINFPYDEYSHMRDEQGIKEKSFSTVKTPTDRGNFKEWNFSTPVPAEWTDEIEKHPDMLMAKSIADFIADSSEEPFAAWCSIGAPHPPLLVPQPYLDMYKAEDMQKPPGIGKQSSEKPASVTDLSAGWQAVRDWNWDKWSRAIAAYYGYTAFADSCMKLILNALEKSGKMNNTIIIATTDHGEMLGAHNIYQKGVLYDRACRIPLVIAAPGVQQARCNQLSSHIDIAPTVLDMLELPPLVKAQGKSLAKYLENSNVDGPEYQFIEFNGQIEGGIHSRGVVSEKFKYIYHHNDSDMLFDLEKDPDEIVNIIDNPEYLEILNKLKFVLFNWGKETGDFLKFDL